MISLDRFEQGLPDIQELSQCRYCGEALYSLRNSIAGVCNHCGDNDYDESQEYEEE